MDQSKDTKEKEFYRREIIEMMKKIESPTILEYLYIFIQSKVGRYIKNEKEEV